MAALVVLGSAALASVVSADPIGPDCGTCQGSIYTLTYSGSALPDNDPLHETFRVTLTIDSSAYSGGGLFIDSASVKIGSTASAVSLFSAPTGGAPWTAILGGINDGGCDPNPNNGFVCANANGTSGGAPVGGTDQWVFDITLDNGDLSTSASIKARYVDGSDPAGKVGDLVSEDITLQTGSNDVTTGSNEVITGSNDVVTGSNDVVTGSNEVTVPGPAPVALIGLGLAGIALWGRIRRR